MGCDLAQTYGDFVRQIPEQHEVEYIFSKENLPVLPSELTTDRIIIRHGRHTYHAYTITCVDALHVQVHKHTCRTLACCLLSKIFHASPTEVRIHLTNPESHIKMIVLDYHQGSSWNIITDYYTLPSHFKYRVSDVYRRDFSHLDTRTFPRQYLPLFTVTDSPYLAGPCDNEIRDIVRGVGSDYGHILLARLLLDVGSYHATATSVTLESEYGYGGVGKGSAEMTLWLPDSVGWLDMLD